MAYNFTEADDVLKIAEQEYASSDKEIRFTKFTSCIGIISYTDKVLTGVHLVMFSKQDSPFNNEAADDAVALLNLKESSKVIVIGQARMWESNLEGAYDYLISKLHNPTVIDKNDGVYGARIHEGKLEIYENGNYHQL